MACHLLKYSLVNVFKTFVVVFFTVKHAIKYFKHSSNRQSSGLSCLPNLGEYNLQIQDVSIDDEDWYECQVLASEDYPRGLRSQKAFLSVVGESNTNCFYLTQNNTADTN